MGAFTWSRYRPWLISLPQALRGPRICNLNPFNHFHLSRPLYRRSGLEEVMRKSHQAVEEEPPHHSPAAYQSSSPLQCFKSTCSLTEESGGSRQKMEATKSGGSNTKARFVSAKVGTSCCPVPGIWIRGVASTTQAGWNSPQLQALDGLISGGHMYIKSNKKGHANALATGSHCFCWERVWQGWRSGILARGFACCAWAIRLSGRVPNIGDMLDISNVIHVDTHFHSHPFEMPLWAYHVAYQIKLHIEFPINSSLLLEPPNADIGLILAVLTRNGTSLWSCLWIPGWLANCPRLGSSNPWGGATVGRPTRF